MCLLYVAFEPKVNKTEHLGALSWVVQCCLL